MLSADDWDRIGVCCQMRRPAQGATGGWVARGLVLVDGWHGVLMLSGGLGSWSQCSHSKDSGLDLWSGTKIPQGVCYGIK